MHWAVIEGHAGLVALLCSYKELNPDVKDNEGLTPFDYVDKSEHSAERKQQLHKLLSTKEKLAPEKKEPSLSIITQRVGTSSFCENEKERRAVSPSREIRQRSPSYRDEATAAKEKQRDPSPVLP